VEFAASFDCPGSGFAGDSNLAGYFRTLSWKLLIPEFLFSEQKQKMCTRSGASKQTALNQETGLVIKMNLGGVARASQTTCSYH
jgi:hypothetical protein